MLLFAGLIIANVFLFTTPTRGKKSDLTLAQLEARADDPGEINPPPPGDDFPPTRIQANKWSLSAIIEFLF